MSGVSKIIFGTETLIDLTEDTVTPEVLFKGDTAHKANGDKIVGIYEAPSAGTMIEKTVTADGTYKASDDNAVGYSKVIVQKPFNTGEITITEDGTYNASDEGYMGYTKVIVNVPGGSIGYKTTIDGELQERDLDFLTSDNSLIELPYNHYAGHAVVLDTNIYLIGDASYQYYFYVWNGVEWIDKGQLPIPVNITSNAIVYNDEIHILGGGYSTSHYKWDGSDWSSVSTLPYNFINGSAVVLNNEIHILGGSYDVSDYTSHYKWNGTQWDEVSTLPYDFYGGYAVVYNDEIHIMSGDSSGSSNLHYKWNGSSWSPVSTLPNNINVDASVIVYKNRIRIMGGNEGYDNLEWDGDTWNNISVLPYNFYGGSAVILEEDIYMMGGSNQNAKNFYVSHDGENFSQYILKTYTLLQDD